MNRANPYIDLIDSDSGQNPVPQPESQYLTSSNSFSLKTNSRNPIRQLQFQQQKLPKYEDVACFKQIRDMPSLACHYFDFREFLQNRCYNVLFVFGPSGCGKTLLVQNSLSTNGIPFEYAAPKVEQTQDGDLIYQDIFQLIEVSLKCKATVWQKVVMFKEFPLATNECGSEYLLKYKVFRQEIHSLISGAHSYNKYIFILNTQIYSPFYLLSENSQSRALQKLHNVKVMKMEAYGIRQMQDIIKHFVQKKPLYSSCINNPRDMEEIITEANGDARKAFHLIYHRKISQLAPKGPPKCQQLSLSSKKKSNIDVVEEKQEQKVTIFHMLGKFLYGKRFNKFYNPQAAKKKDRNEMSIYYTEQELKKYDPKFYFKPVELFDRSHMTLNVFSDLLQENFLNRFGKVADIASMYNIFRYYDSYLSGTLNRLELMNEMQFILKQLLTWGILIYNRNSVNNMNRGNREKEGMQKIQRSKNNINKQLITKKLELIKSYFLSIKEGGKYRLSDIINLACFLRFSRSSLNYPPLMKKLVEMIIDNRQQSNQGSIKDKEDMIENQQQDMVKYNCTRVNKIGQEIAVEIKKIERLWKIMPIIDESQNDGELEKEQSDIDSDEE